MIRHKRFHKQLKRTIGKGHMKRIIYVSKKAKKANNVFELVNTPIGFCELTDQYFPHSLPYPFHKLLRTLLSDSMIPFNNFCNIKDIAESIVDAMKKLSYKHDSKQSKIIFYLKMYVFIYKLSWFILGDFGIHKDHQSITVYLDYINYFIGLIRE